MRRSNISIADIGSLATFFLLLFTVWKYRKDLRNEHEKIERLQAKNISAWVISNAGDGGEAWLAISNQSESPVYGVITSLVSFSDTSKGTQNEELEGLHVPYEYHALSSVLPPGKYYVKTAGHLGMNFRASAEIAFIDNSGINWIRNGDGSLKKIDRKPLDYYDLSRPPGWEYPQETMPLDSNK